jgi:hypothetical protein
MVEEEGGLILILIDIPLCWYQDENILPHLYLPSHKKQLQMRV